MTKKIVAISDTHTKHHDIKVPKCDFLIHCGDFSGWGTELEAQLFLEWFSEQPATYKICIAGNHDIWVETNALKFSGMAADLGVIYLQDQLLDIDGVSFYGFPWTPIFGMWAFMLSEESPRMKQYVNQIPDGLDILISHGPPFQTLDTTIRGKQVGSKILQQAIVEKEPNVVLCGHIHEGRGTDYIGDTKVINCSMLNAFYKRRGSVFIVNID